MAKCPKLGNSKTLFTMNRAIFAKPYNDLSKVRAVVGASCDQREQA
jgi:hypothetical protein